MPGYLEASGQAGASQELPGRERYPLRAGSGVPKAFPGEQIEGANGA
jgi:hypothetical protein